MRQIKIFDTTLRDGEQSPGCSMNLKEKIEMGKQLEKMGVDVIEAGFAISSPGDFTSVKTIAESLKDCTVVSMARASEKDIDRAWEAVQNAVSPRIHVFIATSPIHMEYKLKMTPEEVMERSIAMVKYIKKYCSDIEFSAEDATRSDLNFLGKLVEEVVKAGATTVNLPDTVGYTTPDEHYDFFMKVQELAPSLSNVTLSAHCHNDLGLGVANSLAAIKAGASQVECTVNGIGERAGNAAMEEIVMALDVRKDILQAKTGIITTELTKASNMLSRITGVKVQPNKAIVGENAFSHESGIHQHGMMTHRGTYEVMTPESVGASKSNMILGKHSGKHAFKERVESMGYNLNEEELVTAFEKFKMLADRKKNVYDKDIEVIVAKESIQVPKTFTLDSFVINSGNTITSTAVIRLLKGDELIEKVARGDGPIDASYKAIDKILGQVLALEDFQLDSVTEGEDAQGDCFVKIKNKDGEVFSGRGLSTDIIESSIFAYVNAINKMIYAQKEGVN